MPSVAITRFQADWDTSGAVSITKRHMEDLRVHSASSKKIREHSMADCCAAAALADSFTEFSADRALRKLSAHERPVYELLEIVTSLRISNHESYYSRILIKLNLKGMHELRRHAIDHCHKHAR